MQSVEDAFSVEEAASTRNIAWALSVAWRKQFNSTTRTFTIGTSTIGGVDVIPYSDTPALSWQKYQYFDESDYATEISYERLLNLPEGGLTKALADFTLDNTSDRFTPSYLGGQGELSTAILPSRPVNISAGFHYDGADHLLPQFIGVTNKTPRIDQRARIAQFEAADFMEFLSNKYVDETSMYTSIRSDVLMANVLTSLGYTTADYDLDIGQNLINFTILESGGRFGDFLNEVAQAELGHIYQSPTGKVIFRNRTEWSNAPYNQVQRVITTAQVLNYGTDPIDHIVNVVEIRGEPRAKASSQTVFTLSSEIELLPGSDTVVNVTFDDPILSASTPVYTANTQPDGSGTNKTANVSIKTSSVFAQSARYIFTNNLPSTTAYLTTMTIQGRPALVEYPLYYRAQDDSSVTAYEEHPLLIENDYIQSEGWAQSIAQNILNDFAEPENLQEITIRAIPELELGDLISWQGRHWRIYGIITKIDPDYGFIQDLSLFQRAMGNYFQIGVSTIQGDSVIAP